MGVINNYCMQLTYICITCHELIMLIYCTHMYAAFVLFPSGAPGPVASMRPVYTSGLGVELTSGGIIVRYAKGKGKVPALDEFLWRHRRHEGCVRRVTVGL